MEEKSRVAQALSQLPFCLKIYPSDANFLLVKMTDAQAIYDYLLKRKIIVRNRTHTPLCHNCLRITIGSIIENTRLLAALRQYSPNHETRPDFFIRPRRTLIREPADEQIDSFEKLEFMPGMIRALSDICRHTDYELVMVSNQDGLGTISFPEEIFGPYRTF